MCVSKKDMYGQTEGNLISHSTQLKRLKSQWNKTGTRSAVKKRRDYNSFFFFFNDMEHCVVVIIYNND